VRREADALNSCLFPQHFEVPPHIALSWQGPITCSKDVVKLAVLLRFEEHLPTFKGEWDSTMLPTLAFNFHQQVFQVNIFPPEVESLRKPQASSLYPEGAVQGGAPWRGWSLWA
jgi:hypothetical protein